MIHSYLRFDTYQAACAHHTHLIRNSCELTVAWMRASLTCRSEHSKKCIRFGIVSVFATMESSILLCNRSASAVPCIAYKCIECKCIEFVSMINPIQLYKNNDNDLFRGSVIVSRFHCFMDSLFMEETVINTQSHSFIVSLYCTWCKDIVKTRMDYGARWYFEAHVVQLTI